MSNDDSQDNLLSVVVRCDVVIGLLINRHSRCLFDLKQHILEHYPHLGLRAIPFRR